MHNTPNARVLTNAATFEPLKITLRSKLLRYQILLSNWAEMTARGAEGRILFIAPPILQRPEVQQHSDQDHEPPENSKFARREFDECLGAGENNRASDNRRDDGEEKKIAALRSHGRKFTAPPTLGQSFADDIISHRLLKDSRCPLGCGKYYSRAN